MRYERKYKIADLSLPLVHQVVQAHPFSFRKAYPDRQVNNIYFDGPDLDTYVANAAGVSDRRKFRIRWYGAMQAEVPKPIFEIKYKSRLLGSKKSKGLPAFKVQDMDRVIREVRQLPEDIGNLSPTLINTYWRSYYLSQNGRFRITIDSNLRFNPYSLVHLSDFDFSYLIFQGLILELKYDMEYATQADEVMQYLPFRNTKNSKYAEGLALVWE